jgi:predicted alpha-1,6-mannanase (GH76 family)
MDEQGGMFKGAFIRGLASLHSNEPEQAYADFFKKNADSVWNNAKNDAGLFKDRWQVTTKWTPAANTASHASGIDVLVAAASA